ncbi:MAG: hypothetical protein ACJ8OJ_08595, partial [Povalibacter sp.]
MRSVQWRGTIVSVDKEGLQNTVKRIALALRCTTWAVVCLLAIKAANQVWDLAQSHNALPLWDMARHGAEGARLADNLRRFDLSDLLSQIARMDLYPPLFYFLEGSVFRVLGADFSVGVGLIACIFALAIVAAFWAGRMLCPDDGGLAGTIAAAAVASSPVMQLFGGLVMLEMPGALALLIAAATYLRWLRSGKAAHATTAWSASAALLFTKFNYGLSWLVPQMAFELWRRTGSVSKLVMSLYQRSRRALANDVLLRSAAIVLVLLLVASRFAGRVVEATGETRVRLSIANPLYALYVIALVLFLLKPKENVRRLRGWLDSLDEPRRRFLIIVAGPFLLWMLYPVHFRGFIHFLENRSGGESSDLLFYPYALMTEYSASPTLGGILLALALLGLVCMRRVSDAHRMITISFVFALIGCMSHPYKQLRFAFLAAPLMWLSAAGTASFLLSCISTKKHEIAGCLLGLLVVGTAFFTPFDSQRLASGLSSYSAPASTMAPL